MELSVKGKRALVTGASGGSGLHFAEVLALEWARNGIRVNALCPGCIEAPINTEFLASDATSYMTGSIIAIDGGHLVSGL